MTEKALSEAKAYVERSLQKQAELGYARPPKPVIRQAVEDTARAIDKLMALSSSPKR